jgi:plastocyanin
MQHLDDTGPPGEVWDETIALLTGELVALRTRLAAVEAAVGRPGPVGAPAPPALPALARRLAALERQAGIVPGLDLLAGSKAAPTSRPAVAAPTPRSRGQVWRDRGQAVLAAVVLLAVFAWLLRPTVRGQDTAQPTVTTASAPTAAATAAPPLARGQNCATLASEVCAGNDGHLAPPAACLAPVGAAAEGCGPGATAPRATTASSATWTVALTAVPPCAGDEPAVACPRDPPFAPAALIIQVGDAVVWQVTAGLHTVTFPAAGTPAPPLYLVWPGETAAELNPLAAEPQGGAVYDGTALVGSGVLDGHTPVYQLTFPRPGRYVYVDLAQPALVGVVIVLAADRPELIGLEPR